MLCYHAIPDAVKALLHRPSLMEALDGFALGGGTSLALRFGHRWSVDLDFFTRNEFDPAVLFESMELAGATVLSQARNSLTLDVGGVKVDLLRHHYPLLESVDRLEGLNLLSVSDLAAMKINAIVNRGAKKDFFDLAHLLNHGSLQGMLDCFQSKYAQCDVFAAIRSLAWFEDAEFEPDPVSFTGSTWDLVKANISHAIQGL